MSRPSLIGMVAVFLFATNVLFAADTKEATPKLKGKLPVNWSKLGLTEQQKQKVFSIRANYQEKIDDLQKQLNDMKRKEQDELVEILTVEQKAHLREILTEKVPTETKKPGAPSDPGKTEPKPAPKSTAAPEIKKPEPTPSTK